MKKNAGKSILKNRGKEWKKFAEKLKKNVE